MRERETRKPLAVREKIVNRAIQGELDLRKDLHQGEGTVSFVMLEARAFPISQNLVVVMKKELQASLYRPPDIRARDKGDRVLRRKTFEVLCSEPASPQGRRGESSLA